MNPRRLVIVVLLAALSPAWAEPPDAGHSPDPYQALLSRYVGDDGSVDYARWHDNRADVDRLDQLVAELLRSPPERPQLEYWLNLYNALVLNEIVRRWPLGSVAFVDGGTAAFFRQLTFPVGGKRMSLDQIENEVLRGTFHDARIHFAINCGSRSCPVLKPEAFAGHRLAEQLDQATAAFINDPQNVSVEPARRTVRVSQLFDWYRDDFVAFARERARPGDLFGFLSLYARPELAAQLQRARAEGYRVGYAPYDWSTNDRTAPAPAVELGKPAPDVAWALLDGGTWKPSQDRGQVLLVDFWATYCTPCRAAFPKLAALARSSRGLKVVGIAAEPPGEQISRFVEETGATFPICVDPEASSQEAPWGIRALPTEVLIDRKGVVREVQSGLEPGALEKIAAKAAALLREKP